MPYDISETVEHFMFGANAAKSWTVKHDRFLAAVGSVEARLRSEHDEDHAHEERILACTLWQQRAAAAKEFQQFDTELAALRGSGSGSELKNPKAGMGIADANKHAAFEFCHFAVNDHLDESVPPASKRARHTDANATASTTFDDLGQLHPQAEGLRPLAPIQHNNHQNESMFFR